MSKTETASKLSDYGVELTEKIQKQIKGNSDEENAKWMKALKDSKSNASLNKAEKMFLNGYPLNEGTCKKLGYTEADMANPEILTVIEKEALVVKNGKAEKVIRYSYKIANASTPFERLSTRVNDFILEEVELTDEEIATIKAHQELFTDANTRATELIEGDASFEEKFVGGQEIEAELTELSEDWSKMMDGLAAKYNAWGRIAEYRKEFKVLTDAVIEKETRKENFSIALINLKLVYIQAEINDRMLARSDKIVQLAKKMVGDKYKAPKPSGKRA